VVIPKEPMKGYDTEIGDGEEEDYTLLQAQRAKKVIRVGFGIEKEEASKGSTKQEQNESPHS
jgi:hypothetical protein